MKDAINVATKNKYVQWGLLAAIVIAVGVVIYQIVKSAKLGSQAAGEIAGGAIIAAQTGVSIDRQQVCKIVAEDCNKAVWRVWLADVPFFVANSEIVDALNRLVSVNEAALTSAYFRQLSGDSLKAIVEGGLFRTQNAQKIRFRNALT